MLNQSCDAEKLILITPQQDFEREINPSIGSKQ